MVEADLLAALHFGWLDGASLDVFATEPLPADSPLWDAPGLVVSAHMSGDVVGWRDTLARQFVDNAERWLAGKDLVNVVDKELGYVQDADVTDLCGLAPRTWWPATRAGDFSPVDAARAALQRIASTTTRCNAFLIVDEPVAMEMAEASARALSPPASRSDRPTAYPCRSRTCSSRRAGPPSAAATSSTPTPSGTRTRPATARLREAGTVFLGKTTTPEFAWKGVTDSIRQGVTGNPWGAGLTSGGSSGGSATAVGLGMGTWSVGTDGGGSVRIPASFTGTVALKATYGLVPMYPSSPYGTLSHAGPQTRTVTDAAMMLDVIAGLDCARLVGAPAADHVLPRAVSTGGVAGHADRASQLDLGYGENDAEVAAAVRAAAEVLAEAGAEVEEVSSG